MQLTGVDEVEPLLAHVLEPGNNLSVEGLHAIAVSLATGEVQIQMLAQKSIRYAGKTRERVLDPISKQSLTKLAVIDRNPE